MTIHSEVIDAYVHNYSSGANTERLELPVAFSEGPDTIHSL